METFSCMCAHLGNSIPTFADPDDKKLIKSKLPLKNAMNKHFIKKGSMHHVRVFRHATQTLYSKTKGGLDHASQFRTVMNAPGGKPSEKRIFHAIFQDTPH